MSAKTLFLSAVGAYKQKQYSDAARLMTEALTSDDLDSFVDYIGNYQGSENTSEQTLSPTYASSADQDLSYIAQEINESFVSLNNDDDDAFLYDEIEAKAEEDGEEYDLELESVSSEDGIEEENKLEVLAGPVGIKA